MEGSRFLLVDEEGEQCSLFRQGNLHSKVVCSTPRKGTGWRVLDDPSFDAISSDMTEAQIKRHVDLVERKRREEMEGMDEFSFGPERTLLLHSNGEEHTCSERFLSASKSEMLVCARGEVKKPKSFAFLPVSDTRPERGVHLHVKAHTLNPKTIFTKGWTPTFESGRLCGDRRDTGVIECPIVSNWNPFTNKDSSSNLTSFQVYEYVSDHRRTEDGKLETRSGMKNITECVSRPSVSDFRSCVDGIKAVEY